MAKNLVRLAVIVLAVGLITAACSSSGSTGSQGAAPAAQPTTGPAGGAAAAPTIPPTETTAAGGPAAGTATIAPIAAAATSEAAATGTPAAVTTSTSAAPEATVAMTGTSTAAAAATPPGAATAIMTGTATAAPAAMATAPAGTPSPALVQTGQALMQQLGCVGCHSVNGSKQVGPTFKGLYGSQVTLNNGQTVTADAAYIRQSILQPNSQIVQGFQPNIMPNFGQLSDQQVQALIAYIESLR